MVIWRPAPPNLPSSLGMLQPAFLVKPWKPCSNLEHVHRNTWIILTRKAASFGILRVPGGVQHRVWTHLHSFLIIRKFIHITMLKPFIFWNLISIVRHCHCSSDTLTYCSEMPASCNGQLQMLHQVTGCVILTTLLNRLRRHSPRISKNKK